MFKFFVSVPARVRIYITAKTPEEVTEAMVLEELGKVHNLGDPIEVFTDRFSVLDDEGFLLFNWAGRNLQVG